MTTLDQLPDVFPASSTLFELFDHLPTAYFYAKDQDHRYIGMNHLTLENVFGLSSLEDILGKTDFDFHPPMLAEAYHEEDRRVMKGRKKIPNQVWLVPHVRGTPQWFVSTKVPLINEHDEVCGIAGVMYPIATPEDQSEYFRELAPIIRRDLIEWQQLPRPVEPPWADEHRRVAIGRAELHDTMPQ